MAREIEFKVVIELDDDSGVIMAELEETLAELEEVCAKRGYGLYDAGIYEDGECLTGETQIPA